MFDQLALQADAVQKRCVSITEITQMYKIKKLIEQKLWLFMVEATVKFVLKDLTFSKNGAFHVFNSSLLCTIVIPQNNVHF